MVIIKLIKRQEAKNTTGSELLNRALKSANNQKEMILGCGGLVIDKPNTRAYRLTTSPNSFQEMMMIKPHSIKENSRTRRDAQRKAKQQAWSSANPLLFGRKCRINAQTISLVRRAGYSPTPLRMISQMAFARVKAYKMQIIRATYLFEYEFKRKPMADGGTCLPGVAKFAAGFRKSESLTAR